MSSNGLSRSDTNDVKQVIEYIKQNLKDPNFAQYLESVTSKNIQTQAQLAQQTLNNQSVS